MRSRLGVNIGYLLSLSIALLVGVAGCAGLTARKVPLLHRLSGRDHQQGFRYYTSRPHLVVNAAVPVEMQVYPGVLVKRGEKTVAIRALLPDGDEAMFDLSGNRRVELDKYPDWESLVSTVADRSAMFKQVQYIPSRTAGSSALDLAYLAQALSQAGDDAQEETDSLDENTFQVVHLPDFEEQFAIRHHGWLSQGSFALRFKDGWQLDSVQDAVDETDIPIRLLQLAQTAVEQAAMLDSNRLQIASGKESVAGPPAAVVPGDEKFYGTAQRVLVITRTKIEPGVYRLTKRSERSAEIGGHGILSDLGIPVVQETRVQLIATAGEPAGEEEIEEQEEEDMQDMGDMPQAPPDTGVNDTPRAVFSDPVLLQP